MKDDSAQAKIFHDLSYINPMILLQYMHYVVRRDFFVSFRSREEIFRQFIIPLSIVAKRVNIAVPRLSH